MGRTGRGSRQRPAPPRSRLRVPSVAPAVLAARGGRRRLWVGSPRPGGSAGGGGVAGSKGKVRIGHGQAQDEGGRAAGAGGGTADAHRGARGGAPRIRRDGPP